MGSPRNAALQEVRPDGSTEWHNPEHPCRGVNTIVSARDGRVELLTPDGKHARKKFALVGFSTATRDMAPMNDPEWAIVGMNQLARHLRHAVVDEDGDAVRDSEGRVETELRHADLWFEIHEKWNTALVPGTDHAAWLRDCDIPCYMTEEVEGLPHSVRFPIDRLIKKFELDYFTSTVAYMVAWAVDHIDHLVEERFGDTKQRGSMKRLRELYAEYAIGVFGIDLIVGQEYEDERPCAEFWLGQAMARNITLTIPRQSALLTQHYRYGYEMQAEGFIRASDLTKRHDELAAEHVAHNDRCIELWGRLRELERGPQDEEAIEERHAELTKEHQAASEQAVLTQGQLMELERWRQFRTLRERGAAMEN